MTIRLPDILLQLLSPFLPSPPDRAVCHRSVCHLAVCHRAVSHRVRPENRAPLFRDTAETCLPRDHHEMPLAKAVSQAAAEGARGPESPSQDPSPEGSGDRIPSTTSGPMIPVRPSVLTSRNHRLIEVLDEAPCDQPIDRSSFPPS